MTCSLASLDDSFFVDKKAFALKKALLLTTSTSKGSTTSRPTSATILGSFRGGDGGFDDAFHKITCTPCSPGYNSTYGYTSTYDSLPSLLKPGHKFTVANNLEISTGSSIFCVELLRRHQPDSTRWTNFFGLKLELKNDDFRAIARSALSGRARVLGRGPARAGPKHRRERERDARHHGSRLVFPLSFLAHPLDLREGRAPLPRVQWRHRDVR